MTQPEGTVKTCYDQNGFVGNAADGRMLTVERSNNVDTAYGYDSAGRLNNIAHTNGATIIDEFSYSLDGNGNRTAVTSTAGTESYTLDGLNRVTDVSYPGAQSETFVYDAAGNRVEHTNTDGDTIGFTVDDTGQLISDTTGTTYSYDQAGNLLATSAGDSYVYDDYGRTVEASGNGITQTFGYDAADVRVTVDSISQLWDRNGGLPTLISTGVGDNYVHTNTGIARDGDDWLLADAVGSVRATVDDTGATTGSQDFTVFGEQLAGSGDFGFAGEQADLTGQLYLRARQYNPTLGRFTTVDPVQPGAPGTTGYNLYTYSGNNPTTFTDPTGRQVVERGLLHRVSASTTQAAARKTGRLVVASVLGAAYAALECGLERGPFGGPGEVLPGPCGVYDRFTSSNSNNPSDGNEPIAQDPGFYQELADFYLVSPQQIENCVLNYRTHPQNCDGLPDGLLQQLFGDSKTFRNYVGSGEGTLSARLSDDGTLTLTIVRDETTPSGAEMFSEVIEHFGGRIQRIEGQWFDIPGLDTNYNQYQAGLGSGLSPNEAARATFTGQQAQRFGFTTIETIKEGPGEVIVTFGK